MILNFSKYENMALAVGLIIKMVLAAYLASPYLNDLFIPFVNYYVSSGFQDPYVHFVEAGDLSSFPYPAVMLYVLAVPSLLFGWLADFFPSAHLYYFIYRLPLLAADLVIFIVMRSWLHERREYLVWLYWLSPVLIYISYIHGQLDAIPISFLFLSLFFLFKKNFLWASIFLGVSLAAKTHIILALPFIVLYLQTQNFQKKYKQITVFLAVTAGVFLLVNLPFLFDPAFMSMVFHNKEQGKLFLSGIPFGDNLHFYLIPACFLLLWIRGSLLKSYNKNILIMFLGFAFGTILLFIPPMPGWYFWLVPFLCFFYVRETGRSPLLFAGLQVFYLLYFFVTYNPEWIVLHGIDPVFLQSLFFTLLQTTLLFSCILIYRRGIQSYSRHKITSAPYFIGIGGNSGTGKSLLSSALTDIFGSWNTTILRGDDMHKWERGHKKWQEVTHLDPKANHLHREIRYLSELKHKKQILRRHYDHKTGQFTQEQRIRAGKINIFEGLHPFYLERQRSLYDLKIFISPQEDLALHWKVSRDMKERGHSLEKIMAQVERRQKDLEAYVEYQLRYADIVVEVFLEQPIGDVEENAPSSFTYRLQLPNSVYVEDVAECLSLAPDLSIKHQYCENDRQLLDVSGIISKKELAEVADQLIPGLKDIGINEPEWPENAYGAMILILAYYIFEDADYAR